MRTYKEVQKLSTTISPPTTLLDSNGKQIGLSLDKRQGIRLTVKTVAGGQNFSGPCLAYLWNDDPSARKWVRAPDLDLKFGYIPATDSYDGTFFDAATLGASWPANTMNGYYLWYGFTAGANYGGTATVPADADKFELRIDATID